MRNEIRGVTSCDSAPVYHRRYGVGGKAHNLYHLRRAGYRVPYWVVVGTRVFDEATRSRRAAIARLVAHIDFGNPDEVVRIAGEIADLIAFCRIPMRTASCLSRLLGESLPGNTVFAVRSSAYDEDDGDASFAGQMDTLLNVAPEQLIDAIRNVWISAYSARALMYRHRCGKADARVRAAVIVQEMIQAKAAGVMFTRDPLTMRREVVISAAAGPGEGVVQGTADVHNYHLGWEPDSAGIEAIGGVVGDPETAGAVLSDRRIRELRDIAVALEGQFGAPQDIEWAIDGNDRLYLLQTRPITTGRHATGQTSCVWDNSNVCESYPGLTLPLTFSFVRECYERSVRQAVQNCLARRSELRSSEPIFANMIGLLHGRVYYRLLNWYRMLSYLPGFNRHKEAWDRMIGINGRTDVACGRLSLVNRTYAIIALCGKLAAVRRNHKRFQSHFEKTYAKYQKVDFGRLQEEEAVTLFEAMRRDFSVRWHLTIYNDFAAMKYYDWLMRLCRRWMPDAGINLHNELLCGVRGVDSVRPVHSLLRIAAYVRTHRVIDALLRSPDDGYVWQRIKRDRECADIRHMIDEHIREYGDRAPEDLKLESLTFRDSPQALIGLIREYVRLGLTAEMLENRENLVREKVDEAVEHHLHGALRKVVFRMVLSGARQAVVAREGQRLARTRLFGLVRRLFNRLGERLAALGVIRHESDIHYLTVSEVMDYINGTSATMDLRALADLRRYEYESFALEHMPGRFETTGVPYSQLPVHAESGNLQRRCLAGVGCSSGIAEGHAWVVDDPTETPPTDDCVLVARSTDPAWIFLMVRSRGIVVERGSLLSHTAIVGRELGIPTVVGVAGATMTIATGDRIRLNGETGEVLCLS